MIWLSCVARRRSSPRRARRRLASGNLLARAISLALDPCRGAARRRRMRSRLNNLASAFYGDHRIDEARAPRMSSGRSRFSLTSPWPITIAAGCWPRGQTRGGHRGDPTCRGTGAEFARHAKRTGHAPGRRPAAAGRRSAISITCSRWTPTRLVVLENLAWVLATTALRPTAATGRGRLRIRRAGLPAWCPRRGGRVGRARRRLRRGQAAILKRPRLPARAAAALAVAAGQGDLAGKIRQRPTTLRGRRSLSRVRWRRRSSNTQILPI